MGAALAWLAADLFGDAPGAVLVSLCWASVMLPTSAREVYTRAVHDAFEAGAVD